MKSIKKVGLISVFAFAMIAFLACDDSSLASSGAEEYNDEINSSSSAKASAPAEVIDESSDSMGYSSSAGALDEYSSFADVVRSSSSSVTLATPCKTENEDNCEYGTLLDERDGQEYKTVKIGDQWWMAESLNFNDVGDSYCYNDSVEYCEKYGRFYNYIHAKADCPSGWRLPSDSDFKILVAAVGDSAGRKLKSTTGWEKLREEDDDANGIDAFGFSALPAGMMWVKGTDRAWMYRTDNIFISVNQETAFWGDGKADVNVPIESYYRTVFYYPSMSLNYFDRADVFRTRDIYYLSVRCIKESE